MSLCALEGYDGERKGLLYRCVLKASEDGGYVFSVTCWRRPTRPYGLASGRLLSFREGKACVLQTNCSRGTFRGGILAIHHIQSEHGSGYMIWSYYALHL